MIKTKLLSNILLAIIWVSLTGNFSAEGFVFGFMLSYVLLWLISTSRRDDKYFTRGPKIIAFFFFFIYELVKANLQVAYDVMTPRYYMKPGIIRIPLHAKTDLEITLLANLISLTPGTLSLDVSDDKKVLYVHAMYVSDKEAFIHSIKNGFERKLLEILR
ncbi:Na+/H+ antiporter subunit E [Litoribacter populi]|uniref:Na+/H+ antiporter subunit E n=1 Tax=Litoribacter populi TaxID=2598460 RepID=UPI00163D98CE|nr:Na+/H+ antiporter subunit E [Litoribacter populi]